MTVIVLTACPERLRGYLTRWLLEVAAGVYVGHVTRRVEEELWSRVEEFIGRGKAVLITSARNEQRMNVKSLGHDWTPVDLEGLTLMLRPAAPLEDGEGSASSGWSSAGQRRRTRRR